MNKWTTTLDQGGEVDIVFCDFMKAFDKVPHRRMIDKLRYYGFLDPILGWIRNFLSDRTQSVTINNTKSTPRPVLSGIPQGSVLGPVLFVIYINTLPDVIKHSALFLFADDTKVFKDVLTKEDSEALQQDLDAMWDWSGKSLLKFHPDKCKSMSLSKSHTKEIRTYSMGNGTHKLSVASSEKDIGVTVDSHLSFEEHIQAKVNKANSTMAVIRKTYSHLDEKSFLLLYKAIVRPHLEYANAVWAPHLKKHVDSIENVQRRATRQIVGLKDKTYEERLRHLKLPTLSYRRLRGDMIETFKILTNKYDEVVCTGLFELNKSSTRGHSLKIHKQHANSNVRKYFFTNRVVDAWNSLPNSVIDAPSIKSFESRLDKHWSNHPLKYCYNSTI